MSIAELVQRLTTEANERRIRQVSTATAGLADGKAKDGN
jgi:hypothetical protein